jgi:hypothetical protein
LVKGRWRVAEPKPDFATYGRQLRIDVVVEDATSVRWEYDILGNVVVVLGSLESKLNGRRATDVLVPKSKENCLSEGDVADSLGFGL